MTSDLVLAGDKHHVGELKLRFKSISRGLGGASYGCLRGLKCCTGYSGNDRRRRKTHPSLFTELGAVDLRCVQTAVLYSNLRA